MQKRSKIKRGLEVNAGRILTLFSYLHAYLFAINSWRWQITATIINILRWQSLCQHWKSELQKKETISFIRKQSTSSPKIRRALCPERVRSKKIDINYSSLLVCGSSWGPCRCLITSLVPPWCLPGASLHPLTWSQVPLWMPKIAQDSH